jgi:hypothetical protein
MAQLIPGEAGVGVAHFFFSFHLPMASSVGRSHFMLDCILVLGEPGVNAGVNYPFKGVLKSAAMAGSKLSLGRRSRTSVSALALADT